MANDSEIINKPSSSRFGAMLSNRCPHCRSGKVFPYSAFSLKFHKMYDSCPVCGQDFIIEPGFYYGAMYISYAITIIIEVAVFMVLYVLFNDPELWVYIVAITATLLLLSPLVFRLSRMLMLTYFGSVKYDPGAAQRSFER
jgi:uncharacterized protein (DUF983 family)